MRDLQLLPMTLGVADHWHKLTPQLHPMELDVDQNTSQSSCQNSGFKHNEAGQCGWPHSFHFRCQFLRMCSVFCGFCWPSDGLCGHSGDLASQESMGGLSVYLRTFQPLYQPAVPEDRGVLETSAISRPVCPQKCVMVYRARDLPNPAFHQALETTHQG